MEKYTFGKLRDGREAHLYRLMNPSGAQAVLSDFGAALVSLQIPDRSGKRTDVVLGYDRVEQHVGGLS